MKHNVQENRTGKLVWSSHKGDFAIYQSKRSSGSLVYRNTHSIPLPSIPLILKINKQYVSMDKAIRSNSSDQQIISKQFFQIFETYGIKCDVQAQSIILKATKKFWHKGHELLKAIGSKQTWRNTPWPKQLTQQIFGNDCFAYTEPNWPKDEYRYTKLQNKWRKEGLIELPGYFAGFGVLNAEQYVEEREAQAIQECQNKRFRQPTTAEKTCIQILKKTLREINSDIMQYFDWVETRYRVLQYGILLGAYERNASGFRKVYLSDKIFLKDFAKALSVFLHEHAHGLGYDGTRELTDALTDIIESVIRYRNKLDQHEKKWQQDQQAVQQERIGKQP